MNFTIANVKISVKILSTPLDIVSKKLKECQVTHHNNFIVVRSKYTFIIFKPKLKSETNHINITKIPHLNLIKDAIDEIEGLLRCNTFDLVVDNISATSTFPCKLDLVKLVNEKKFDQIKYNNQAFPGLFLKFEFGTAIIFHSGKINIVGCKSEKNLEWILHQISVNI